MATVKPTQVGHAYNTNAELWEWSPLNAGDTVGWLALPPRADKTVHAYGAFGGAITFQGTLETPDTGVPAHPFIINDARGRTFPISFVADDAAEIMEHCIQIRPQPGAGVTNTTVRLLAVGP